MANRKGINKNLDNSHGSLNAFNERILARTVSASTLISGHFYLICCHSSPQEDQKVICSRSFSCSVIGGECKSEEYRLSLAPTALWRHGETPTVA